MVIPREPQSVHLTARGLRRDYTRTPDTSKQYLLGVLHDATVAKTTYRIATKDYSFCQFLIKAIKSLNGNAWSYKEGKLRNLWIVEFSQSFLKKVSVITTKDKIEYIRGYFDAEGGIAKSSSVRYYIYFCQKDENDLLEVKKYLSELGIETGVIHNPSKRVDPDYWRFFIRSNSYEKFAKIIGSNHPEKRKFVRMKI